MNTIFFILITAIPTLLLYTNIIFAYTSYQGCCSGHGGISYKGIKPYCRYNKIVCKDSTLSSECTCQDEDILTDYSYRINVPKYNLINYTYKTINNFNDWNIIQITTHGNELALKTGSMGKTYTQQYSNIDKYTGGILKGKTDKTYYIRYNLRVDIYPYQNNEITLFYDFDKSNNFIQANIYHTAWLGNIAIIYFQPQDITQYYQNCIKKNVLTFKLITKNGETMIDFSLHGYAKANSLLYNKLN